MTAVLRVPTGRGRPAVRRWERGTGRAAPPDASVAEAATVRLHVASSVARGSLTRTEAVDVLGALGLLPGQEGA